MPYFYTGEQLRDSSITITHKVQTFTDAFHISYIYYMDKRIGTHLVILEFRCFNQTHYHRSTWDILKRSV